MGNSGELEGPTRRWYMIGNEWEYDFFYMGLRVYHGDNIPKPRGNRPKDYKSDWTTSDYYDKPIGWQQESKIYNEKLRAWKQENIAYLRTLSAKNYLSGRRNTGN